ncbi:hypothetical protein ACGFNU_16025 [Spirillospora sp. NPDC048911]|uniref:hypothetical protein n=1 Tax=Spirillospora sp. NPDC048911 TaxID=3364527 RepID=UPI00371B7831
MGYKKLVPALAVPGIALAMLGAPAASAQTSVQAAAPAAKAGAGGGTAEIQTRKGWACSKPKGKKFNISYDEARDSTTFYFNNHCKTKRTIRVVVKAGKSKPHQHACITVNPGTKGKKKVWHQGWDIVSVTSPKEC